MAPLLRTVEKYPLPLSELALDRIDSLGAFLHSHTVRTYFKHSDPEQREQFRKGRPIRINRRMAEFGKGRGKTLARWCASIQDARKGRPYYGRGIFAGRD